MFYKILKRICIGQNLMRHHLHTSTVSSRKPTHIMAGQETGVDLKKVVEALESFAPTSLAESWDNTGLLVEPYTPRQITKILLTNDLTEAVMQEVKTLGCEMIISYHPPIFAPIKSVTQRSWKERIVSMMLESGVALYSPHTGWDAVRGGVNDWLASALPFASSEPIVPGASPDIGAGRLLKLSHSIKLSDAIDKVKQLTGLRHVRVAAAAGRNLSTLVSSVALCAGSGTSVLKGVQADLYITGEMLHHDVLDAAQRGVNVILTNHSDSERGFLDTFRLTLTDLLGGRVSVHVSQNDRDPLVTV